MIIFILLTGVAGYLIYHNNIVGLVLSLPDSNQDFVFTGDRAPKEGTVPAGLSPAVATVH